MDLTLTTIINKDNTYNYKDRIASLSSYIEISTMIRSSSLNRSLYPSTSSNKYAALYIHFMTRTEGYRFDSFLVHLISLLAAHAESLTQSLVQSLYDPGFGLVSLILDFPKF